MAIWSEPLTGSDRYGINIDADWLEEDSIGSVQWVSDGVVLSNSLIEDNVISTQITRTEVNGAVKVFAEVVLTPSMREKVFRCTLTVAPYQ